MAIETTNLERTPGPLGQFFKTQPSSFIAGCVLTLIVLLCFTNGFGTIVDPLALNTTQRLSPPTSENWLGTDIFGRDIYSRVVVGGQLSLIVGLSVAAAAIVLGTFTGLLAGYYRVLDPVIMRVMDGLMSIPALLLAIALVAVLEGGVLTVIIALTIPEIPRVVRLVRSIVLVVREEPYIEAAVMGATPMPLILLRHVLPNAIAPMIVLGTYIIATAILIEASLSFLGAGIPPETPSWGNVIAQGRSLFEVSPWIIFAPATALALTVLSINVLGDGLRETLDPRVAKKM